MFYFFCLDLFCNSRHANATRGGHGVPPLQINEPCLYFPKKNAATSIAASIQVSDPKQSLAAEPHAVTTQEAVPVIIRKVAKAGILEIMRSLRIIALTPTRIIRTGL